MNNIISIRDTYVERVPKETANDRNDRAIRTAALWYQKHLDESCAEDHQGEKVKVILLTNDMANKAKAVEEGLLSYTGY